MKKTPRILLAAMSLQSGNGGIGRLARLTARVLARETQRGNIEAQAITLLDNEPATDLGLPVRTAVGSRLRFVSHVQLAALTNTHVIYDFLGTARAHCSVPFLHTPFLAWICGVEVWPESVPNRQIQSRFQQARRANQLVSISEYTRQRSQLEQAKVCWLATESDELPPQDSHTKPPRVLMLSRVDETYKGHDNLVECWPQVVAAVPNAVLTFAGRGPRLEPLRRKVAASPSASQIEILGFVPETEMDDLWQRTAVLAMPSRGEGFGLVYIEAMRQGIPVIATTHDAGQEVNVHGVTGFNVNLDNPSELSDRLIQLLRSPNLATEMGQRGREHWRTHFPFSAFESRFVPILSKFVAQRGRAAA